MDSSMALGLYHKDKFRVQVLMPDGKTEACEFPSHYTVDQIKTTLFKKVPSEPGVSKKDFDLCLSARQGGEKLTVDFARFMYCHVFIEAAVKNDEVVRIQFKRKRNTWAQSDNPAENDPFAELERTLAAAPAATSSTATPSSAAAAPPARTSTPSAAAAAPASTTPSTPRSAPTMPPRPTSFVAPPASTAGTTAPATSAARLNLPPMVTSLTLSDSDLGSTMSSADSPTSDASPMVRRASSTRGVVLKGRGVANRRSFVEPDAAAQAAAAATNRNVPRIPAMDIDLIEKLRAATSTGDAFESDSDDDAAAKDMTVQLTCAPGAGSDDDEDGPMGRTAPDASFMAPSNIQIIRPGKGWSYQAHSGGTLESLRDQMVIQEADSDINWYSQYFYQQEHVNLLGTDKNLGPVVLSFLKEQAPGQKESVYRAILRTKEATTAMLIPADKVKTGLMKSRSKEILKYINPELVLAGLKESKMEKLPDELLNIENRQLIKSYKIGILYCKQGQVAEEDMFHNDGAVKDHSPEYQEFLDFMGETVRLLNWDKYRAGLDVKQDGSGTHSVYTQWRDFEIMFHVATLLPYYPNDYQQLQRKRHLGNDIAMIVFVDGTTPYVPTCVASQFNHVIMVIQPVPRDQCPDGKTYYRMAMCNKEDVRPFGPAFPGQDMYEKNSLLRDYIFTKVINGERSSYFAEGFRPAIVRTRFLLLKNCVETYGAA